MTRFIPSLFAAAALVLSTVAAAGELEDKAAELLAEAIQVAEKGDFDKWIKTFCDPERCHTALSKDQWKAYQLKQLQEQGKHCIEDGKVTIARWRGDLSQPNHRAKAYITCSNRQLPPPVEFRYDPETKKLYIRQTSI